MKLNRRELRSKGNASEFAIAFYVFLFLIAIPLIDLIALAGSSGLLLLAAHETASEAASQHTFFDCLDAVDRKMNSFLSGNLARFGRLTPIGGYKNCGADMFIDASNFISGGGSHFGPNKPVPPPIDTSSNVYECTIVTRCKIAPAVDLSFIGLPADIPGLTAPAIIALSASRAAEHPRGLEFPSSTIATTNGVASTFNTDPSTNPPGGVDQSGWNNPSIYEEILTTGQRPILTHVLKVYANNSNFTDTLIDYSPGDKLWFDFRSDGLWSINGQLISSVDADGDGRQPLPPNGIPLGRLTGKLSAGPVFEIGKSKVNYQPPGSGRLKLIFNDSTASDPNNTLHLSQQTLDERWQDNTGYQVVRVILTR